MSCELAGAQELKAALHAGHDPSEVRVLRAPCMGRCDTAPALEIGHAHIDHATPEKVAAAIDARHFHADIPGYQALDAYRAAGGYAELEALRGGSRTPDEVQETILESGLRGLGGAGFPSGRKWSFVRAEKGPRYLAVNGDEGEPGTFKDRYYLEREPHVFLEGMLIAAWAVEAETCFIYMRDEYPAVLHILAEEIRALEAAGIVAEGYIDIRRGAGAYICGEESAMIESIEGKRGLQRTSGLERIVQPSPGLSESGGGECVAGPVDADHAVEAVGDDHEAGLRIRQVLWDVGLGQSHSRQERGPGRADQHHRSAAFRSLGRRTVDPEGGAMGSDGFDERHSRRDLDRLGREFDLCDLEHGQIDGILFHGLRERHEPRAAENE